MKTLIRHQNVTKPRKWYLEDFGGLIFANEGMCASLANQFESNRHGDAEITHMCQRPTLHWIWIMKEESCQTNDFRKQTDVSNQTDVETYF